MSLFKAREWWSTTVGDGEEFDLGCLCTANVDNSNNAIEKIVVGSYHGFLRIYNPKPVKTDTGWSGYKPEDVVCEMQLSQPILQIEAGRFVSASEGLHLAILHPRKISVYSLAAATGAVSHGTNYSLKLAYEHNLKRTTCNFCYGPFGGIKNRDFLCVQSMDGTLSVFEQESFAFSRFLPGALLPGPIKYVNRTDSFVTVSSSRQIESYKYQVLAVATDAKTKDESLNLKSGKRVAADWVFNIGEQAIDIKIVNFVNAPPSIYVLGERNLYILSEVGKLRLMKKFEFTPVCFVPYPSMVENSINCVVATTTQTLMIYQDTTLKWAAQLDMLPVQIKTADLNDLKGVLVTLDEDGHLMAAYLGTDPALFMPPSAAVRELDYSDMDKEMAQLQHIIKEQQAKSFAPLPNAKLEEDIQVQVHVPRNLDIPTLSHDSEVKDEDPIPSITVKITLKARVSVTDVKVSVHAPVPLTVNESLISFPSLEPSHPGETQVSFYMKNAIIPTDLKAEVTVTYTSIQGAPRVVHSPVRLPIMLVIKPYMPVKNAQFKLTIDTNKAPVNLNDLFPDLLGESAGGAGNALGFKYYGLDPVVTLLASKTSQRYRLQCDDFSSMWMMLHELCSRLSSHFRMGSDFKLSYDGSIPLQEYFDVLDAHFDARMTEEKIQKLLDERASQFRAIQRRLLTRFKDKTPSPLANLDTLLDGTYRQILALVENYEENHSLQEKSAASLSAATRIINMLIKFWQDLDVNETSILEAALSPNVMNNGTQGWEEMVDAAITHLLRTCLAKNSKDTTINPAPLAMLKETTKLKKHIALVCDRLSKGAKLSIEGYSAASATITGSTTPTPQSRIKSQSSSENLESSNPKKKALRTTLDDSSSGSGLGSAEVPVGSRFGEKKSPRTKKDKINIHNGDLPPLGGTTGSVNDKSTLPPLTSSGMKFMKNSPADGLAAMVPDLDDMGGTSAEDEDMLMNGGDEMVYGL